MKALILAAGMGKRLLPLTADRPKPMVKLLNKPIIEYTLDALAKRNISEIIIVVGYCKQALMSYLGDNYKGIKITYVHNDDYESTNNIYSLKLGLEKVDEDLILCEGDVAFDKNMLDVINENPARSLAFVDKYEPYMHGTIVKYDKSTKRITELITADNQGEAFDYKDAYKSVNVYYLTRRFLQKYFQPALKSYLSSHSMNAYYEIILQALLHKNNKELYAFDIDNAKWFEIDDADDLRMAECIFSRNNLESINLRYGGYWRYDFMDFSYLYNPHFPAPEFYAKLADALPKLIANYPSGHRAVCEIFSAWYEENGFLPDNLVLANGASELIRIINKNMVKKITVPVPTFNEYESGLNSKQINYFYLPPEKEFELIKEDFVKSVKKSASNIALIINPNNPTGGIIPAAEISWILEQLKRVMLIVDESFIDLSGERQKYSVQNLVGKYDSLVIIRSMSKEFGVPGLRLGYLLTANKAFKNAVLEHLPVWNINSIAEYFIEHFIDYRSSYAESIKLIIKDRNELYKGLKAVPYLEVLPSHANFFLCKVKGSAKKLQQKLFNEFKILVKDCSNKKSLEQENYIRIAVKTKKDNDRLIAALKSLTKVISQPGH